MTYFYWENFTLTKRDLVSKKRTAETNPIENKSKQLKSLGSHQDFVIFRIKLGISDPKIARISQFESSNYVRAQPDFNIFNGLLFLTAPFPRLLAM